MLLMRTAPVTVLEYGQYTRDDGSPMTRKDGSPVEFVRFQVEGEDRYRDLPLDGAVNGQRVEPGTLAELVVESRPAESAEIGRSGRPYIRRTIKFRVSSFAPSK